MTMSQLAMLDAFEALVCARRSVRQFLPAATAPVPAPVLQRLLSLVSRSPSSFNAQPWLCVVVRSEPQRGALAGAMLGRNQAVVKTAPLSLVFAADTEPTSRLPRLLELERDHALASDAESQSAGDSGPQAAQGAMANGVTLFGGGATMLKQAVTHTLSPLQPMPSISSPEAWAFKQTMPAVQTFLLGAVAAGLSACPMEGFDGRRVRDVLRLPGRFSVPVVVAAGYAADTDTDTDAGADVGASGAAGTAGAAAMKEGEWSVGAEQPFTPRLPLDEVFFVDEFGGSAPLFDTDAA